MFFIANFFYGTAFVLRIGINFLQISIIISAVLSFILPYYNPVRSFFDSISNFICRPIRRVIPLTFGPIDFTPYLALLLLIFVDKFLIASLFDLSVIMR
ncbi:MAG TPA: YggT family protein [Petrotogaceae bacterium]|nr:YggT family protein [Petrotogaceae bacterium]HNV06749.1 YggT family protein [Petrotogaceae bacterium]HNY37167.1 YggT family protein [Petrotogaceae bacterium]HOG34531.1 YggT family protein [Petrotogaceae bacterium]HPA93072.1 YggT family protein [Petrotogaceae bacterium]